MMRCPEKLYFLWPESNQYLKMGILSRIVEQHHNHLQSGFIFVDFSLHNIKLFTTHAWLTRLENTGMRIVLIADRFMEALATYWEKQSPWIVMVLYAWDDRERISVKIDKAFIGARVIEARRKKITDLELQVLGMFLNGNGIRTIAIALELKEKRVYNLQHSLQAKLGCRLKLIASG